MALRRKERPLTLEEIKLKLANSQSEFWKHSDPLCALTMVGEELKLLPLSNAAEQGLLIIFLLDAGDYTTDRIYEVISEWKIKYRDLPWIPVIVFEQKYMFLSILKFFDRFKQNPVFVSTPLFLDSQGEWFQYFKTEGEPHVIFLNQGNVILKEKLWPDLTKKIDFLDEQLQEILRISDPGLPLPENIAHVPFQVTDKRAVKVNDVAQGGVWMPANQSLLTDNSQAVLSFDFEGKYLRLLSITHPQAREDCRVQISLNDLPIPTPAHGDHLHSNDKGQSVMEINRSTGLYELIYSENALKGKIKLTFLNAVENPVIFYELRVG